MMAASAPLNARVKIAAKGTAGTRSSRRNRSDADASTSPGGGAEGGAEEMDVKNGGEGLNELEALLTVSELRTSFAFTKVAAQKYRTFLDVHFDTATPGGVDLARLGWKLYLAAKHRLLPKFPDLYSCYHLLVVVQAFLLVNAPRGLLRTELKNMVSMSVRDESGDVDALASLSVTSKTKLPLLRSTMEDFQRDIVQGVVADELGGGGGNKSPKGVSSSPGRRSARAQKNAVDSALQPAESPGEGLSKRGPARFPALLPDEPAAVAKQALAAAATAADAAYLKSCKSLGHLRLDERLYLPVDGTEEADSLAVLGDIKKPATTGGSGGVAATPGPGKNLDGNNVGGGVPGTPWRLTGAARSLLGQSPARLGTPYASAGGAPTPGGTGSTHAANNGTRGGGGVVAGRTPGAVPFTPISEAMASASWLHAIVAPPSPNGTPKPGTIVLTPTQRLKRFVSEDVAKKLMDLVHNLAGKTSAALREDAFLVTINGVGALAGQGHNVSLDNLVKRRQEEAVRVFAYFLELILENEQRLVIRQAASAPCTSSAVLGVALRPRRPSRAQQCAAPKRRRRLAPPAGDLAACRLAAGPHRGHAGLHARGHVALLRQLAAARPSAVRRVLRAVLGPGIRLPHCWPFGLLAQPSGTSRPYGQRAQCPVRGSHCRSTVAIQRRRAPQAHSMLINAQSCDFA